MALLKKYLLDEQGFSIIETLTAIVILGLIMAFSAMLVKGFFFSPKGPLKGEALTLASGEMDHTINTSLRTDTSYFNAPGNLLVERNITEKDSLLSIGVSVKSRRTEQVVLTLHAYRKL